MHFAARRHASARQGERPKNLILKTIGLQPLQTRRLGGGLGRRGFGPRKLVASPSRRRRTTILAMPADATAPQSTQQPHHETNVVETLQSLIVAFVLAMTFRGFVTEGFVIPTGS